MKRLSILAIVLLAVLATACSSSQPTPTATPEPTPEPTPSEVAASGGAFPSLEPGAGNLEDVLPAEVGGIAMTYQSASGAGVIGSQELGPEAQAFFDAIGAEPSDLSSAFGTGIDIENEQFLTILAFRVAGVDEGTLRTEFLQNMAGQGDFLGEETQVGGKTVNTITQTGTGGSGFLYVNDDVVFVVNAQSPELAEEALATLP